MKMLPLLAGVLPLCALLGCQSTPAGSASRTIEPGGAQARYSVEIPADTGAQSAAQPFALQGSPSEPVAVSPGMGYQAR